MATALNRVTLPRKSKMPANNPSNPSVLEDLGLIVMPRDIHAELLHHITPDFPHGPLVIGVDPAIPGRDDARNVAFAHLYQGRVSYLEGARLIESEQEEVQPLETKKPKHPPSRLMMSLLSRALPPKPVNWGFFHPPKENSDS